MLTGNLFTRARIKGVTTSKLVSYFYQILCAMCITRRRAVALNCAQDHSHSFQGNKWIQVKERHFAAIF